MVAFKKIKYKHYRQAQDLIAREEAGEDVTDEYMEFLIGLIAEWDFVDEDTGKPMPVNLAMLEELSIEQVKEAATLFNQKFAGIGAVPKANAGK